jgi:hypothetical protein
MRKAVLESKQKLFDKARACRINKKVMEKFCNALIEALRVKKP